jgi:hypothetical protein
MIDLCKLLEYASLEKDVETAYTQVIKWYYPDDEIYHCCGCDAYLSHELLIEYKYDVNLKSKKEICKVLSQIVFYLRRLSEDGIKLPAGILIGDVNECIVLDAKPLFKYIYLDIDWSIRPSEAYKVEKLMKFLTKDPNINPRVFNIKPGFDFKSICKLIDKITPLKSKKTFKFISIEIINIILLIINIILTLSIVLFK